MSEFFRRSLPHYHPPNATYFVTFRLAESLPANVLKDLKEAFEAEKRALAIKFHGAQLYEEREKAQKRYFARVDAVLDAAKHGPTG